MTPEEIEHAYRRLLRQLVINVRNIDAFIDHMKTQTGKMHPSKQAGVIRNAQKSQHTFERSLGKHRPGLKHFWGTCDRVSIATVENWTQPVYTQNDENTT